MKIGVTANYVTVTSKMRKLADGDAKTFKSQLDKIRLGLDGAYQGQENLTGELLSLEKKIDAFSSRMSSLASVFDQGASELLTSANQAVNVGELAPLSKELEFVLANPTTAQLITRNQQILTARAFTEKYKNSAMLTSPLGATLFAGASTMALLPLLNTDTSNKGVDEWYKENYAGEYHQAVYELYRKRVDSVQKSFPNAQKQVYEINASGNSIGGRCNVAAMGRLLNRRSVLDGHAKDTFSVTDVINQSGAKVVANPRNGCQPYNKGSGVGYQYTGGTGTAKSSKYTSNGVSYQAKVAATSYSSQDSCRESLTTLLNEHPEGLYIHMRNGSKGEHAIVLTDYEIDSNGNTHFYFSDSWGTNPQRNTINNLRISYGIGTTIGESNFYKYIDTVSYLE